MTRTGITRVALGLLAAASLAACAKQPSNTTNETGGNEAVNSAPGNSAETNAAPGASGNPVLVGQEGAGNATGNPQSQASNGAQGNPQSQGGGAQ